MPTNCIYFDKKGNGVPRALIVSKAISYDVERALGISDFPLLT